MSHHDAVFFSSPAEFGAWLAAHHDSESELWVGYFKKHTGRQVLDWSQAVDEALCWGWIDGLVRRVDEDRTAQRFTPRKARSHWSRVNVEKVATLETAGRMRAPGRAAFARRTEENTAQASFEREALPLSADFAARLAAVPAAQAYFAGRAPGYRRRAADWVMSAKRPATRETRLQQLIEDSGRGLDVKPLRQR